jgi:hypothetical protein
MHRAMKAIPLQPSWPRRAAPTSANADSDAQTGNEAVCKTAQSSTAASGSVISHKKGDALKPGLPVTTPAVLGIAC